MPPTDNDAAQSQPDAERLISDIDTLKVYFDPMRMKVIQAVAAEPRTVHEIAAELNVPFTRLYYHVNMLERHGLIRVVETRNLSGAVEEKYYQVSARVFVIDRKLLTVHPGEGEEDALDTFLAQILEGTHRDILNSVEQGLVDLTVRPPDPDSLMLRHTVSRMPPARVEEFNRRLLALVEEFSDKRGASDDPYYALTIALYRSALAMNRDEGEDTGKSEKA